MITTLGHLVPIFHESSTFMTTLKETVSSLFKTLPASTFMSFLAEDFSVIPWKYDSDTDAKFKQTCTELGINWVEIAHHGGEEQGIEYWTVYKFSQESEVCYVKFDGSYYSYDGCTFDSWYFVEPTEKLVVVYERS